MQAKVLIAYFSRTGSTRAVAQQIQQLLGGDLFEIRVTHDYPDTYQATTIQARQEQEQNFRPVLRERVRDISAYEVVVIAFPDWWGSMPMALFSFLEAHDLAGKTLIPFCTHEGSGFGRSIADLRAACPQARLEEGLALHGGGVRQVETAAVRREIRACLQRLELL